MLKFNQDLAQGFSQIFQIHLEIDLENNIKQQIYIIYLQSSFRNSCILVGTECFLSLKEEDCYNKYKSLHV